MNFKNSNFGAKFSIFNEIFNNTKIFYENYNNL